MIKDPQETVLYVDDDLDDQEFFVSSLSESRPYAKCFVARDSSTAFEIIKTIPLPNFIFIDLHLPRVNGIELLRQLKVSELYSAIPTYVLSTTLFEPHAITIRELGGKGFFRKPSSLSDFKALFDAVWAK
ncbi:MAG TPA: response regulator [Chryseosolibacter sp.]